MHITIDVFVKSYSDSYPKAKIQQYSCVYTIEIQFEQNMSAMKQKPHVYQ